MRDPVPTAEMLAMFRLNRDPVERPDTWRRAWCAGHWRAMRRIVVFTALAMLIIGPINGDFSRDWIADADKTVIGLAIDEERNIAYGYMTMFDIDGSPMGAEAAAKLGSKGMAIDLGTHYRENATPLLTFHEADIQQRALDTAALTLHPQGRECRVIVYFREKRAEARDCLSPVDSISNIKR